MYIKSTAHFYSRAKAACSGENKLFHYKVEEFIGVSCCLKFLLWSRPGLRLRKLLLELRSESLIDKILMRSCNHTLLLITSQREAKPATCSFKPARAEVKKCLTHNYEASPWKQFSWWILPVHFVMINTWLTNTISRLDWGENSNRIIEKVNHACISCRKENRSHKNDSRFHTPDKNQWVKKCMNRIWKWKAPHCRLL